MLDDICQPIQAAHVGWGWDNEDLGFVTGGAAVGLPEQKITRDGKDYDLVSYFDIHAAAVTSCEVSMELPSLMDDATSARLGLAIKQAEQQEKDALAQRWADTKVVIQKWREAWA